MALDLSYIGSFQRGLLYRSENPLEEVWTQIARVGTPEYASSLKPVTPGIDWNKHTNYASVRIRQSVELRNAGRNSTLLTRPITLYYSFLNLLRACMALAPEVIGPPHHGLEYRKNDQLLLNEAKLVPGTFTAYLDSLKLPWKAGQVLSLQSCLSQIPEIAAEFNSPERGRTNVVSVSVEAKMGSNTVRLHFNSKSVDEAQFRSAWTTDYPNLKNLCELGEKGTILKVRQEHQPKDYSDVCSICEKYLLNRLAWSEDALWHALRHTEGQLILSRAGYYFVAVFILGSLARYQPELLQSALRSGTEMEWFFDRFMRTAERFFPQLMFSWLHGGTETYFPGY